MSSRILPLTVVVAMALIALNGCAPPPGTADSDGGPGENGSRIASNASADKEPPRIAPPADIAPSKPVKKKTAESSGKMPSGSFDGPAPGGDGLPAAEPSAKPPKIGGPDPAGGAASKEPEPKKEFKLEFVSATGSVGLNAGDTIPNIEGEDLDGIEFQLSDYEGKVIMIDFWGDW